VLLGGRPPPQTIGGTGQPRGRPGDLDRRQ
jgi:hypothetical protein